MRLPASAPGAEGNGVAAGAGDGEAAALVAVGVAEPRGAAGAVGVGDAAGRTVGVGVGEVAARTVEVGVVVGPVAAARRPAAAVLVAIACAVAMTCAPAVVGAASAITRPNRIVQSHGDTHRATGFGLRTSDFGLGWDAIAVRRLGSSVVRGCATAFAHH